MSEKTQRLYKASIIFVITSGVLCAVCLALRVVLSFFPDVGELFCLHVTKYLQYAFALVSSYLPFSLAETLILLLPLAVFLFLAVYFGFLWHREYTKMKSAFFFFFGAVFCVLINYILNLSMLYCRHSLSEHTGISDAPVTTEEIYETGLALAERLSELSASKDIVFSGDAAVCPYTFDELSRKIDEAYSAYCAKNPWLWDFPSRAKRIALSDYLTYTHLSGIYTQFTGETNINTSYPHFIVTDTIAHEKAHGRGVAPEDEANLTAYFVLRESGDDYLEYCGIMSVYSELIAALLSDAPDYFLALYYASPPCVRNENRAYADFFEKYRTSRAATVNNALNDGYLKLNGETDGIKSYGMIVNMLTAYEKNNTGSTLFS